MKSQNYYINQNQGINEDNYNNIKNVLILTLIIIFAYLIEKFFRNIFINTFFIVIILIIIAIAIILLLFNPNVDRIKNLFKKNFYYIGSKANDEMDKKKLEKVKNIYESGYLYNKMNNNYYSGNSQMFNREQSNFNYNNGNNFIQSKNEDDLANKISNINKINNNGPLMNSFKKAYTNGNSNENNNRNINNNLDYNFNKDNYYQIPGAKNFTNLPSYSSINNDFNKKNIVDNSPKKDMISSPFNKKTRLPPLSGSSSSGNFYLFPNDKRQKEQQKINLINDFNNINPVNRMSYMNSISDFGNNIYENQIKRIPKNKEISYNKYQSLKNRYHNTQALLQDNNMLKYNLDKIPRELASINYKNWIIKMKNFISRNLIPNIVSKHDHNISNLNSILALLGIKITSSLTDNEGDDYLSILKEKIYLINSNKINIKPDSNDNKLNNNLYKNSKYFYENNPRFFDKDKDNNISNFPSMMNFSNYLNDTKENENNKYDSEKYLKKVFFGDTNKIKQILAVIETKISSLEIQVNNEYKSTSFYQRQKIMKTINLNNNPFLSSEYTKTIDNYIKNINDTNNFTLTNLQRLLYERIIINERLYPKELFSKKDEIHVLLVIEYAIERFKQLQKDFNLYANGSRGGNFLNENWCSLLPTDSQLIAHLIINYIETIYELNNNRNQQVFLLSYPSNYNILTSEKIKNPKIQTPIFLYQINPPNIEPKFNIVYDGNLIPCPMKDINLFHAFSIYFYLLSSNSAMFVMNLGIHGFINELLK